MTDALELKPCPFCGGEAERLELEGKHAGGDAIECTSCGASSHVEFGFKENLVSKWNTRASDAAIAELEAKLAKHDALMQAGFAEYERRLAKAVEALEHAKLNMPHPDQMIDDTLAELKGEDRG